MLTRLGILGVIGLAACQPGQLKDARTQTGSSTVTASSDFESLYSVSPYDGVVARNVVGTDANWELELGGEPTRIASLGKDRLVVSLRAERSIAILETTDGAPRLVRQIEVGAEPYGVVANQDGSLLYVAVSQEDRVLELDGDTYDVLRQWQVPDDPRWLSLHPSEQALFVACGYEGNIVRLDLRDEVAPTDDDAVEGIDLPVIEREVAQGEWVELTPRLTGDPGLTPAGDAIFFPGTYVDNTSGSEGDPGTISAGGSSNGYYAATAAGVSRTNPVVVGVLLDWQTGEVFEDEEALPIFFAGSVGARGNDVVRSYPSSVTVSPDGDKAMVTIEGSDAVGLLHLEPAEGQGGDKRVSSTVFDPDLGADGAPFTSTDEAGLYERPVVLIDAPAGPTGVAFVEDDAAWIFSSIDRQVSDGRFAAADREVDKMSANLKSGFVTTPDIRSSQRTTALKSRLDPDVDDGMRLFYSATNPTMAGAGAGISCATCHFESRNDGLTWALDGGPLQTPTLAGNITQTAPVTWTERIESVAHEAQLTSELRMGGAGLTSIDADKIQAFVDFTRAVDVAEAGRSDAQVTLGAEVFHRDAVGCAECHVPSSHFTDTKSHALYGLSAVNTPSLEGVAATAPYLHDGSEATLRDVLETSRLGRMGDTSSLNDEEFDALLAYLETL